LFREYGRRLEAQKELVSQPASPTDLPKVSTLFDTVECHADTGKYRSSNNNSKFHLDAAFIRRVMSFERCSPLLSSNSSDMSEEKAGKTTDGAARRREESTTDKSGSSQQDVVDTRQPRRRTREGRKHLRAAKR
jgi:hypothetical protein